MELEEVCAREAIRHTMSTYTLGGDRGRVDLLATAFTDDGVLEFSGTAHRGHAAIAAALTQTVDAGHDAGPDGERWFVRHNLTSSRIELRSEREADAWTYFQVVTPVGLDHCGVYVDRFREVGGQWLIAHRRVKVDWRAPDSRMASRL